MAVVLWVRPIGDIGGSGLFNLLLLRYEKFFALAEDAVNGLRRTGIQTETARFHAP